MAAFSFDRTSLHAAYRDGLDPREVVARSFARTEALGDPGIFITLAEAAAEQALAALGPFDPAAKPLWGLPFAIKDNLDLGGVPTTAACPDFAFLPQNSATAVRRLLAAGAIPIGKTNLDQFATGLVGVRSPYPIPRNSFDPAIVPGGSSSGSAVAVAQGIVTFALGTDTAGSGRIPAGLNNLVGLKPSLGAVPLRGVLPACQTLDCVSVFALTVPDAWSVFETMAGFDAADPWSRRLVVPGPAPLPPVLRAGVPDRVSRKFFGDRQAEQAFDRALDLLRDLGIELVEVDFTPFFAVANLLYEGAWVAERYAAIRPFIEARPEALHPTTLKIIDGATDLSAADAFAGIYRLAELRRATEAVWHGLDALVVPTVPRAFTRAELAVDPIGPNSALGTYTNFVNLLDLSALAVPAPFRADGFPAGITLIAPSGRDGFLASLGTTFHAAAALPLGATGVAQPPFSLAELPETNDDIELVVVGAHLSGMPLNSDLMALGGRFLRSTVTEPAYRLYALPGGPPHRPGLVRVGDGGAAIATEVWGLPAEAFGRFVAAIPSPLGIGTVHLADGTSPKGFLCETAGLAGAEDVSGFGSWRVYVARKAEPVHEIAASPYPYALPAGRTALVVIDMQRDFIEPGGFGAALGNDVARLEAIVPTVEQLLGLFRAKGWPVLHTRESHKPDLSDCPPAKRRRGHADLRIGDRGPMGRILVRGEPGHSIIARCAPVAGEIVLDKPGKGMFFDTAAGRILADLGVTHLVFAGVTTEVCVQTSMREANDRGFECLLIEDATESYFPEFKTAAIQMMTAQGGIVGWVTTFAKLTEGVK